MNKQAKVNDVVEGNKKYTAKELEIHFGKYILSIGAMEYMIDNMLQCSESERLKLKKLIKQNKS